MLQRKMKATYDLVWLTRVVLYLFLFVTCCFCILKKSFDYHLMGPMFLESTLRAMKGTVTEDF